MSRAATLLREDSGLDATPPDHMDMAPGHSGGPTDLDKTLGWTYPTSKKHMVQGFVISDPQTPDKDAERVPENRAQAVTRSIVEVSPPGFEGTVLAMKKHPEISNPWALSWWMKNRGAHSHKTKSGKDKTE